MADQILAEKLQKREVEAAKLPAPKAPFVVGSIVRVKLPKKSFEKSEKPIWTKEVFQVVDMSPYSQYKLQKLPIGSGTLPGVFNKEQL
ncbi:MAG: hypothetical protein GY748_11450, partial [Planctomycetaceae bacterium]|nr:hypothetical protein [Planctomycetaceae bacterium]